MKTKKKKELNMTTLKKAVALKHRKTQSNAAEITKISR
jgi:hypothetical protein